MFFLGACCLLFVFPSVSQADPAPLFATAPKKANFFLHWTVSDSEARELSKWDIVILDMEVQENSPNAFRLMRQLHPGIKILAYVAGSEIRSDANVLGAIAPLRRDLFTSIPDAWFVKDKKGQKSSFWSGTWIVNVTNSAPLVHGERWNTYLPTFVRDRVMSTGNWDGVMYDNAWENITFFAHGTVDVNGDGVAESVSVADAAWRAGVKTLYQNTRTLMPNAYVFENDGALYADSVHGVQFESFPNGSWQGIAQKIAQATSRVIQPGAVIVNANTANSGNKNEYQKFRFGLGSALLFNSYYGFDYGDQDHGQAWWYDEYDAHLGAPAAAVTRVGLNSTTWKAGLWRRDFAQGVVFVNSESSPKTVQLASDLEHVHGAQDASINDGSVVRAVTVPGNDAVILLKPLGDVRGTTFPNDSFVHVFDGTGASVRTGFFVHADQYGASARIITRVVAGKNREVAVSDQGVVRLFSVSGMETAKFSPYMGYAGAVSLAFGDVLGNGTAQLVTAPEDGASGMIKVWDLSGNVLDQFSAFGPTYTGGAFVAVGDVDNDGRQEIVVGAGAGGGPSVKIFRGTGEAMGLGFFAYAPKFRGGVRVAVGDVDKDGRAEIVTGAGVGGGPHVRVFTKDGALKAQFFAFDASVRTGVFVGVADMDQNGQSEIFAFTKDSNALGVR